METMKDTEVLARLIYRAYIQPDPRAPLEAESLLPFRAALDLYARTALAETPPPLVAMDLPAETVKKVWDKFKNEPVAPLRTVVSETDTGGTASHSYIAGSGGTMPTVSGFANGQVLISEDVFRASQVADAETVAFVTGTEGKPAPARKKSETGMRGLNGGKATEEKREIYARLMAFCGSHGLGARRRIAEASGGKLSIADVQDMTDAKQVDIKKWREAAKAMDRIEAAEGEDVPDV